MYLGAYALGVMISPPMGRGDSASLLRWRFTLGAVFIGILVGLCWLDYHAARPGVYLWPLAMLIAWASAGELAAMFRKREGEMESLASTVYAGALISVLAAGAPAFLPSEYGGGPIGQLGWLGLGIAAALNLAIVAELFRTAAPERAVLRLSLVALAIVYCGGLVGFLVQLRMLGRGTGMLALASLVATVKMSDSGQYFVGRLVGRHKLAPRISPGKTWEGVAGGVLFAVIGAWLVFRLSGRPVGVVTTLVYAVSLTAGGIVGDLAESMLKRDAGVKDSSTWMPGFGGVLDMVDSLLVAGPVAYAFWALGWVRP